MEFKNKKLKEFEEFIRFRKIAIIGLGVSNIPLLDYFYEKKSRVVIFDERTLEQIPMDLINKIKEYKFELISGNNCLVDLKGFDMIFRSPSCLPNRIELLKEEQRGAIITTEVEMVMQITPCKTIGITGSEGKTTTTTLINEILKNTNKKVFLGGNIGIPLFTQLSDMTPEDILVLELSSFQLMEMQISPDIAIITNITPNHLNIHKDYEEYIEAKENIFKFQDENGILILNYDNELTRDCAKRAKGKVIFFSGKEKLENGYIVDDKTIKYCEEGIRTHILDVKDIILRGQHNYENIATAFAATRTLIEETKAVEAVKIMQPVEHRLELVRNLKNVKWYNDSASSSPSRTIAGLKSFDEQITLIAGGYDKNLEYDIIAEPIFQKVKTLILIGQTAGKILTAVKKYETENEEKELKIFVCETLQQAVHAAYTETKPNQIVLFSPASASFDMFKDFADRGKQFKEQVNLLNNN